MKLLIKAGLVFFTLMSFSINLVQAGEANIAVAANFTGVTKLLVPLFEKSSGHKLKVSFGSTGKLYAQIENGAPFDVFLAADSQRPIRAEKEGLAVPGSRFVYAQGQLVLWSASRGLFESGDDYLRGGKFTHVALANPGTAPYGIAAEQVMQHLQLLPGIKPKLVQGDSIAQTFQFVATGNAEIGFVALAQIRGWKGDPGTSWIIPGDFYTAIEQSAVLLKRGAENPAAQAFLEFLQTDPIAINTITQFGYRVN